MNYINELLNLDNKKIILASQSPRRIEMLHSVGLKFEIYPAKIVEKPSSYTDNFDYVRHNAILKGEWVWERTAADLVIAADTIVVKDGQIFEKPKNRDEAFETLRLLSKATHQVITAIFLRSAVEEIIDHELTDVTFYPLSDREIDAYLHSGEPFDKAGAYGIQGLAGLFVKKINGSYSNVVGFPLSKFFQYLKEMKV